MYRTQKYHGASRHELDTFETKEPAIESAKTLHNPDWGFSVPEGIVVLDDEGNVLFDSAKD
jgi:hypothetical protein